MVFTASHIHPLSRAKLCNTRYNPLLMLTLVAEVLSHERIQRFSDYRSLVIAAIKKKDLTDGGTPTPSIPKVSDSGA